MTDNDILEAARRHLATWQPRLGLQAWRIALKVGSLDEDSSAHTEASWSHQDAILTIASGFEKGRRPAIEAGIPADKVIEELVIHELLHLIDQPMQSQVVGMMCRLIGREGALADHAHQVFTDYLESWINRVVRALMVRDG